MGDYSEHPGGAHQHNHAAVGRRRLVVAMAIIGGFAALQFIGALWGGSLALLADAGHMAGDLTGLAVALVASIIAARPPTDRHTFGFRRFEVFGALVNGLLLSLVAVWVAIEALRRLFAEEPASVAALPTLIVAAFGLVANLAALLVLRGGRGNSINLRGAYLEVLGDTLGSVAVIVAALLILGTGFMPADAIASLVIAAMILPRAVLLLRDVFRVLGQSTPPGMTVEEIRAHLRDNPGVHSVHDVHIWQIAPGDHVFSAHVVVEDGVLEGPQGPQLLATLRECLSDHFDVEHSTFQFESVSARACAEPQHR